MKQKFKQAFMDCAITFSGLSTAVKAQVGSIIVKDNRIISIGYNGMPSGWSNVCEDSSGKTNPEVLHAEANAITKVAKSPESCEGAAIFCTHMPCIECAKLIHQCGIIEVYYNIDYNSAKGSGLKFLVDCGIYMEQV
jgi:dCMP deaminase